jgi:protein-L-isoaspartate(D-aspartate) O-methyltransferase
VEHVAMAEITEAQFAEARHEMVEQIALHTSFVSGQIGKAMLDERVLDVLGNVLRHEFVLPQLRPFAYIDQPLPIGYGKTMSQPFIVGLMTDLLDLQPEDRVLEIGTGLGYHSAILARLAARVYSVEIIEPLGREAARRLTQQGYDNIVTRIGDGSVGWRDHSPYEKILVTAAPELIPTALLFQLKAGGRMVIPAGLAEAQQLMLVEKSRAGSISTKEILPVRFSQLVLSH